MGAGLGGIEDLTDGRQELAQTLNLLLLGVLHVAQKLLHALVHDALRKHLQLEELADELDETETLPLRLLRSVVLL